MKSGKDDRWVKYTKMVLKESLIKILEKKPISQITIKEICEDADINRATFYAHYNDQYDLLKRIENEMLENINAHIAEINLQNNNMNAVLTAEKIFEYLKENAKLCKLLLSERGDFSFPKHMMILVYDKIIAELTDNNLITKEDAEYIYSFTINGCVGIVQRWLDDDMKKSARYMAEMIVELTTGLISLLKTSRSM